MSFSSFLYLSPLYCGFDCLCFSLHPTSHSQCCPVTLENWKLSHELSTTQLAAAGSKVETFCPTQSQLQMSIVSCDGSQVDGEFKDHGMNSKENWASIHNVFMSIWESQHNTQFHTSHSDAAKRLGEATTHNLLPCLSLKWFWVFSSIRLLTHTFHFSDSDLPPSHQTNPKYTREWLKSAKKKLLE